LSIHIRVGGVGPIDADLALVGEALGESEDRKGEPFVGRAGYELDIWCGAAGIARDEIYLTNVVKERPLNNAISIFVNLTEITQKKPISAAPRYEDFLEYVNLLREELAKTKAKVFVAFGNTPLYALTGKIGITTYRGSILKCTLVPGRKVIPTFHPAAALRQFDYRYFGIQDLIRARGDSKFPELRWPVRTLRTECTYEDIVDFLQGLVKQIPGTGRRPYEESDLPILALDIEAINDEVSHVGLSLGSEEATSIHFLEPWRNVWTVEEEVRIWKMLDTILTCYPIVAQNGNYDAFMLFRKYGIRVNLQHDTSVAHHIAFPGLPKRLEVLASLYTREPHWKEEGKQAIKRGDWNQKEFSEYNCKDVVVLHDILPRVRTEVRRYRNEDLYRRTMALVRGPIMAIQARGIRIDMEVRAKLAAEYQDKEDRASRRLHDLVGFELNPNSHPQVKKYFYETLGYKPYTGKKGKSTVDEEALIRLGNQGAEAAPIILECRRARKARSTFVECPLDPDGRLRSSLTPSTVSGRLASSRWLWGTGTNQQNYPKSIRAMWIADPDYAAYGMDLVGADNRVVAYLANEKTQIEAFEMGKDLHSITAGRIFGIPPEQVSREEGSAGIGSPDESQRGIGKRANHGLNYDMTPRTAAIEWEMPERDAKRIWFGYHQAYPRIRSTFHAEVRAGLDETRILTNPMGRHRKFFGRSGRELYKEGYNWMAQSTVADVINWWGLLHIHERQDLFKPVELLNQIHDELDFQLPLSLGWVSHADMILRIRDSLQQTMYWKSRPFYLPVELKIGHGFYPMIEINIDKISSAVKLAVMLKEAWYGQTA